MRRPRRVSLLDTCGAKSSPDFCPGSFPYNWGRVSGQTEFQDFASALVTFLTARLFMGFMSRMQTPLKTREPTMNVLRRASLLDTCGAKNSPDFCEGQTHQTADFDGDETVLHVALHGEQHDVADEYQPAVLKFMAWRMAFTIRIQTSSARRKYSKNFFVTFSSIFCSLFYFSV
jgi:CDGSH-type Zn-finger protein